MSNPIYLQSGFMAMSGPNFVLSPMPSITKQIDGVMRNNPAIVGNPYYYHTEMEAIGHELSGDGTLIRDFQFRERVYKAISDCLGELSFSGWVAMQSGSKHLTAMHRMAINDTIQYLITSDTERRFKITNWALALEIRPLKDNDRAVELNTRRLLDNTNTGRVWTHAEFITQWASKDQGVSDMIRWFVAVFGKDNHHYTKDLQV